MNHRASRRCWTAFYSLPAAVQRQAQKNYRLLRSAPSHPSLHFKEIHPRLWSARVSEGHRASAAFDGTTWVWFWIGRHDEYGQLLRS